MQELTEVAEKMALLRLEQAKEERQYAQLRAKAVMDFTLGVAEVFKGSLASSAPNRQSNVSIFINGRPSDYISHGFEGRHLTKDR